MLIGTGCCRYYSLGLLLLFSIVYASHSPYCSPTAVRRSVKLCVRWFWLRLVCVCRSRVCCLLIHSERRFHHQHRRSCVRLVCIWISVRVDRRRGRCCIHHFIHTFDEILRFTLRYFLFRLNIQSAVDAKVRINQKKIRVCVWLREWFSLLFVVFWFFFIFYFSILSFLLCSCRSEKQTERRVRKEKEERKKIRLDIESRK